MRCAIIAILLFLLSAGGGYADEALYGSWVSEDGDRYDILDGFKPSMGAVIIYENLEATNVREWSADPANNTLTIGWSDYPYAISDDGKALTWGPDYDLTVYQKISEPETGGIVNLKTDENSFIDEMTNFSWSHYSADAGYVEFTKTFSNTAGIFSEFDNENTIEGLTAWGVASGVLKIGSTVYLEARITPSHFIAMDDSNEFVVLHREKVRPKTLRTELTVAREEFLSALTTGAWSTPSYNAPYVYKFRPLEGDLKGLRFQEKEGKLTGTYTWEFSIATGAITIGGSEYVGGLVVNELLVFIDKDGDQNSYYRDPFVEGKHFTSADTRMILVSERTVSDLVTILGRQLSQDDTFFRFEFGKDGRTGYFHQWNSHPFQITGETLQVESWYGEHDKIYLIEDYIALGDDGTAYKIDVRQSRLRPKTDLEAQADAKQAVVEAETLGAKLVRLVITRTDGSMETIELPLKNLSTLKSLMIVAE